MPLHLLPFRRESDRKFGYAGRDGRVVIEPTWDFAGVFIDGLARVGSGVEENRDGEAIGGRWGFIDPSGSPVVKPTFDHAGDFSDGLAAANRGARLQYAPHDDVTYLSGGKWGYVDTSGQLVIDCAFTNARLFADGIAAVRMAEGWGLIDRTGTDLLGRTYGGLYGFHEGLSVFHEDPDLHAKKGYLDRSGQVAIPAQYDLAYDFSEGLAAVLDRKLYQYSYIDPQGNTILHPPFDVGYANEFHEGLAAIMRTTLQRMSDGRLYASGGKWGFMDRGSNLAIDTQFDYVGQFSEGLCAVKTGDNWGYIDRDGNLVIAPAYDAAGAFNEGLAQVSKGWEVGWIASDGARVV